MLGYTVITTNKRVYITFVVAFIVLLILLSVVVSVVGSFIRVDNTKVDLEVQSLTSELKLQVSLPENWDEAKRKRDLQLYLPVHHPDIEELGKLNPFTPMLSDPAPVSSQAPPEEDESSEQRDIPAPVREIVIPPQDTEEPTVPNVPIQEGGSET